MKAGVPMPGSQLDAYGSLAVPTCKMMPQAVMQQNAVGVLSFHNDTTRMLLP